MSSALHGRTLGSAAAMLFLTAALSAESTPVTANWDALFQGPGETATLEITGAPGTLLVVGVDTAPGPSFLPGVGTIGLGLTPNFFTVAVGILPPDGMATLTCVLDCGDPCFGMPFYVQAATLDLGNGEICLSNTTVTSFLDTEGECIPDAEGCTPGYWKQRHHADSWPAPLTPDTPFSDVFVDAFPGLSLDDVLHLRGGGLGALGRHTVAALLNGESSDVAYALSGEEVVFLFNESADLGRKSLEELKDVFADLNEKGCGLN